MKTQIDKYIQRFSRDEQKQMEELRSFIHSTAPSTEGISYNMPSFKWNGKIVACFQMYKNHLGLYPYSGNITKQLGKELAGYVFSGGAVQLPKDKPLPKILIKKILLARMDEILETNVYSYTCPKGLGYLHITLDQGARITRCIFSDKKTLLPLDGDIKKALDGYFKNKKDLPKNLVSKSIMGTDFQKNVWKEISKISFGKNMSYKELAEKIGDSKTVRAAGTACGKNQIALFIPCHRVQSSAGKNTGYAWGVERKVWLLQFESKK
jgi:O-6-methylguanine DNA methyltransferase